MTLRKKATGRGLKIPVGRLLAIGTVTTLARIVLQLLIPPGEQAVLEPSVFVMEGTMPVVFTVYGIFVYTALAALFLIIAPRMDGSAVSQGLRFGTALSLLWIVYLLEPLPHAAPLDRITYPVADSLVLLIMGGLCGRFLGTARPRSASRLRLSVRPLAAITIAFVIARLIQHHLIGIYSSAADQPITALVWSLTTGLVSALVLTWFDGFLRPGLDRFSRTLILGVVIFGGNLLLFNFFMPLVFAADLPDLMIRTVIDTLAVTVGVTAIPISFTDVRQLNTNQLSDQPD